MSYLTWESDIKLFQYKIINNIFGTNDYMFKTKQSTTKLYRLCKNSTETLSHLFAECTYSDKFWETVSG